MSKIYCKNCEHNNDYNGKRCMVEDDSYAGCSKHYYWKYEKNSDGKCGDYKKKKWWK